MDTQYSTPHKLLNKTEATANTNFHLPKTIQLKLTVMAPERSLV